MQHALEHFADARHQLPTLMIGECVSDGMNARELAEMWGFSRQRAQVLIQGTRADDPVAATS